MSDYMISDIHLGDKRSLRQMDELLCREGIERDGNLDHSVGIFDDNGVLIATGSSFLNTLRCLAVDNGHRAEGLLNAIVSHLVQYEAENGRFALYIYTKCETAPFFRDLGFNEIAQVDGTLIFMENSPDRFSRYLKSLGKVSCAGAGAVIINANPFTLGHRYLVERTCAECAQVHLFIVSEDSSLVPFKVRERLIKDGTADLGNIIYHTTGDYMVSSATFPSYFLKDSDRISEAHARLDAQIFVC